MARKWRRQPENGRPAGDAAPKRAARPALLAVCLLAVCMFAGGCSRGPQRAEGGTRTLEGDTRRAEGDAATSESGGFGDAYAGSGQAEEPTRRLRVAATIFPYYDFVRQIAGELVELKLVVPAGMDSHSFEPTPADMRAVQEADVLIMNGGAMEHWVSQVLDAVDAPDLTVVAMMDYVDVVQEETVEGMEEEDHYFDQDFDHDGHETEIEYDEHVWTSPVNAMEFVRVIADTLSGADPDHAEEYAAGAERYLEELEAVHEGFLEVSEARRRNMIVVGDKFPFRYLAEEYGFTYRAAFSGCSTDTEPSASTIAYLIDKVREGQIPAVYYLELSSRRVAEIIGEETGAQPLLLHSCHNVTRAEFDAGVTYADLMRGDIESLRKGLDE